MSKPNEPSREDEPHLQVTEDDFLNFLCRLPTYFTEDGTVNAPQHLWPMVCHLSEQAIDPPLPPGTELGRIVYREDNGRTWWLTREAVQAFGNGFQFNNPNQLWRYTNAIPVEAYGFGVERLRDKLKPEAGR